MCIHGGTTATLVVVLDGARALVANVGDSSAVLCGGPAGAHPLLHRTHARGRRRCLAAFCAHPGIRVRTVAEWTTPAAAARAPAAAAAATGGGGGGGGGGAAGIDEAVELSADHSPENPLEFTRIRTMRPCPHRCVCPPRAALLHASARGPLRRLRDTSPSISSSFWICGVRCMVSRSPCYHIFSLYLPMSFAPCVCVAPYVACPACAAPTSRSCCSCMTRYRRPSSRARPFTSARRALAQGPL
jgi:hypothetical protein